MPSEDHTAQTPQAEMEDRVEPFVFWGIFFAMFFAAVVSGIFFYSAGMDGALAGTLLGAPLALVYYLKRTERWNGGGST